MGILKRKRSESEFSFSSGSTFSSPPRPGSSSFNFGGDIHANTHRPLPYGASASHPSGRTMKRFRDNRLPEDEIHQNTLKMLYSAQQQHHHHLDQHPNHEHTPQPMPPTKSSGQTSLHAFFTISSPATTRPDMLPPPIEKAALALANEHTSCEDCGTSMPGGGGGDAGAAMDMDGYAGLAVVASRCVGCGKVVCGSCSVSNLGAEPRCLVCAGR
ncbi:hypothetical protein NKR19_g5341 [Coniochaeta hoffmannii]|uniref:Uncharacterized protein n=1 Tax=Coniochaeta hoffmannii TaxID=91930 RepID=A0AA38VW45_9PEZI|nr:hypothetical protein NKR19_g5341 [Coniochaeta hoffmannii]